MINRHVVEDRTLHMIKPGQLATDRFLGPGHPVCRRRHAERPLITLWTIELSSHRSYSLRELIHLIGYGVQRLSKVDLSNLDPRSAVDY